MFCEVYKSHPWRLGYPPSGPRVLEAGYERRGEWNFQLWHEHMYMFNPMHGSNTTVEFLVNRCVSSKKLAFCQIHWKQALLEQFILSCLGIAGEKQKWLRDIWSEWPDQRRTDKRMERYSGGGYSSDASLPSAICHQ